MTTSSSDFSQAVSVGRPPNIQKLFPNSRALLISGKFIDLAMIKKQHAICMAANGRNTFVIRGALKAAHWLSDKGPGLYGMRDVLGFD